MEENASKHNVPIRNITAVATDWAPAVATDRAPAVATDWAPAMVGSHRGFSVLLKEMVPIVHTVHCALLRQHLVATKLSGEIHEALRNLHQVK